MVRVTARRSERLGGGLPEGYPIPISKCTSRVFPPFGSPSRKSYSIYESVQHKISNEREDGRTKTKKKGCDSRNPASAVSPAAVDKPAPV